MAPDPAIMQAVEQLNYQVTVGDVAAQAGLDINLAQRGLLALATDVGGHLQVTEAGEVAYLFPQNFRAILRSKYVQLQLQEWWDQVWRVLFYLIRISFGIILIISIVLIFVTIVLILVAARSAQQSQSSDDRRSSDDDGPIFIPFNVWFTPDFFWVLSPNYYDDRRVALRQQQYEYGDTPRMNFLESIFSFLFGDGNPNANLEERRWQMVGNLIRNQRGAVIAEQITPYLDDLGQGSAREYEEYMLPVLTRFNGQPEVSPEGELIYHFPELQTTATERRAYPVPASLQEAPWRFSQAGSGQKMVAISLGVVNLLGALALGRLLANGRAAAELGGLVAYVQSIYWFLLGYGVAFLSVPLVRYGWIQVLNRRIATRNQKRLEQAEQLMLADDRLQQKLTYAEQFAAQTIVSQANLAYTTETDLIEQEIDRAPQIDAEWQQRLERGKTDS